MFGESRPARLEQRPLQRSKSITPKVTPSPLKRGALQMRGTQAEACATKHETFTRKGRILLRSTAKAVWRVRGAH